MCDGLREGLCDGLRVGLSEGERDGFCDGLRDGVLLGRVDGGVLELGDPDDAGLSLGVPLVAVVGAGVEHPFLLFPFIPFPFIPLMLLPLQLFIIAIAIFIILRSRRRGAPTAAAPTEVDVPKNPDRGSNSGSAALAAKVQHTQAARMTTRRRGVTRIMVVGTVLDRCRPCLCLSRKISRRCKTIQ